MNGGDEDARAFVRKVDGVEEKVVNVIDEVNN